MISRLTASAALFAVFATAGIAFAADAHQRVGNVPAARATAASANESVTLPMVVVTGHRAAR